MKTFLAFRVKNEMVVVPSSDGNYLASCAAAVRRALTTNDPSGVSVRMNLYAKWFPMRNPKRRQGGIASFLREIEKEEIK